MRARVPWRNTDRTGTILLLTGGAVGWGIIVATLGPYGVVAMLVAAALLGAALAEALEG